MARTSVSRRTLAAALLVAIAGCREELTMPGRCPALCPSGNLVLADTLLTAPDTLDTSVRGYVALRDASFLLASSLDSLKSLMLMRFSAVGDSFMLAGDSVPVTISGVDSVLISFTVGQRDTAAKQMRTVFYRLPARFDTTLTYAQALPYFADSLLVDTVAVPDSLQTGVLSQHLPTTLRALPGDSGIVSLGVAVLASIPTAFGVGSGNIGSSAPRLSFYVRGQRPQDTVPQTQVLTVEPSFGTFVLSSLQGQPLSGVLAVGGLPAARATLELALPKVVIDSNAVVRATLTLTPVSPAVGFARDSFYVEARPLLRPYGPKSVLYPDSLIAGHAKVHVGDAGPVEVDIAPILRLWGSTTGDSLPRMIMLRVFLEGQVLGEVDFKGRVAGASGPQLRVTYVKRYRFGVP
jgi:hypothetical protein